MTDRIKLISVESDAHRRMIKKNAIFVLVFIQQTLNKL